MFGKHCLKTWCSTQGAVALSSAEAEFYAMIEAVLRAKGLQSVALELGFQGVSGPIRVATDSNAAKSFVSRKGLGKMRHLEIKDLWIQKEVGEGKVLVEKVRGDSNPADLMTKVLHIGEINLRLEKLNISIRGKANEYQHANHNNSYYNSFKM